MRVSKLYFLVVNQIIQVPSEHTFFKRQIARPRRGRRDWSKSTQRRRGTIGPWSWRATTHTLQGISRSWRMTLKLLLLLSARCCDRRSRWWVPLLLLLLDVWIMMRRRERMRRRGCMMQYCWRWRTRTLGCAWVRHAKTHSMF